MLCMLCIQTASKASVLALLVAPDAVEAVNSPVLQVLFKRCVPLLVRYNKKT